MRGWGELLWERQAGDDLQGGPCSIWQGVGILTREQWEHRELTCVCQISLRREQWKKRGHFTGHESSPWQKERFLVGSY